MSDTETHEATEIELPAHWRIDSLVAPLHVEDVPKAPDFDDDWDLDGVGTAWVYLADKAKGLVEPVILSDGFQSGPTDLDFIYNALESGAGGDGSPGYKFVTALHEKGKDLVILGYEERSASILVNARAAIKCIELAIEKRVGDAPLAVGGFSMGGLVTRYALAKMETDSSNPEVNPHQTAVYFSYDSPHRGAWIPISLQAFAHFFVDRAPAPSEQINSHAAQELLLHHITTAEQAAIESPSPLRTTFLAELERVGGFPKLPHRIGVANGPADGASNGVPAEQLALECKVLGLYPAKLWTQSEAPDPIVAQLWSGKPFTQVYKRPAPGMLEFDGAPGGMLASFKIAADALNASEGLEGSTTAHYDAICFIPVGSAVAVRDLDDHAGLYDPIGADEASDLHEFKCSTHSEDHSLMTEELGSWLVERL